MEKALLKSLCIGLILFSSAAFGQPQTLDTIYGQLNYHNQLPMNNVNVYLKTATGAPVQNTVTNTAGQYVFNSVAPGNYKISFSTNAPAGGVNLSDAFTIFLYCMGYIQLNPIQILASDVNGSGSVTLADYTYMMINYLTQGNQFPIGPWVFETISYTASGGSRTGTGVSSSGSSSGDANGTFVPTKNGMQISTFASHENVSFDSKKNIPMPIKVSNATRIGGMHLAFQVPEGLVISNVTSPLNKIYFSTEGNILRVTWFDCNNTEMDQSVDGSEIDMYKPILNVEAELAGPVEKGKVYTLELLGESHFINTDGEVISGMQLVTPALTIVEAPQAAVNTYPNPFFGQATFSIDAPYAGSLKISLYDNAGRLVREVENQYIESGKHQANLDGQDLTPGIYFYNISIEGQETFTLTGSIIKSR